MFSLGYTIENKFAMQMAPHRFDCFVQMVFLEARDLE